jgi:hypothetical protein
MISAVEEGAQVALQATTIGPSPQAAAAAKVNDQVAEKSTNAVAGARAKGDTVTISTEAKQLTSVALNSAEESQESPKEKSQEESSGKK